MAINLLPAEEKRALEWDRRRRIAVATAVRVVAGAAVLWATLAGVAWYLRAEADRIAVELLSQRELLAQSELQQLETSFKKTVQLAEAVRAVAGSAQTASPVLIEVAQLVPSGVELKSIEYVAKGRRRTGISGYKRCPNRNSCCSIQSNCTSGCSYHLHKPVSCNIAYGCLSFSATRGKYPF